jgi:glycosyltransferase involved in cell wall biosynthesis
MLAVIETHPVQYHAPVYRAVARRGVPVTAIYGSDFSVAGYHDQEFDTAFSWDTDLLAGYESRFLSRTGESGARDDREVSTRGLGRTLAEVRPDAVLVVGYSPGFHRGAWFEAWKRRVPILFRGETSDAARDRGRLRERLRHAALSCAYRTCARCLYIGRHSYAHLRRHGVGDDRLVFSPYCVDDRSFEASDVARERWRAPTRAAMDVAPDRIVVCFSGKLSERKGVDLLAPAVRALPAEDRRRIVLLFVGDGERRAALEALAAGPPAVEVRFAGFQNQGALSRYYHAADVLVLPSRHSETWGLVVNEALLHGVPVVASDRVGCAPDLVVADRTGAVFAAGDVEALARALASVLRLVGRTDVRRACREHVARYSVDAAAAGIVEAYAAVTASAGRAA